jgi:hypothetical protein
MQKDTLLPLLEARGWTEQPIPDPTLLPGEASR